eukprot:11241853-Alexandrium_andersonii.AAC.1
MSPWRPSSSGISPSCGRTLQPYALKPRRSRQALGKLLLRRPRRMPRPSRCTSRQPGAMHRSTCETRHCSHTPAA